jgi:hypothetical protein
MEEWEIALLILIGLPALMFAVGQTFEYFRAKNDGDKYGEW